MESPAEKQARLDRRKASQQSIVRLEGKLGITPECNHVAPMWLGSRAQIMCDRCGFTWIDPVLYEALATKPIELSTEMIMAYITSNGYEIPQQALTN